METALGSVLVGAVMWATYTDIRARRIANWLTFGAAALGLAVRLILGGPEALLAGVEGWLLGLAILAVPFTLRWMGGGDVKLLAAVGALGGPAFVLRAAIYGLAAGGVLALGALLSEGRPGEALTRVLIWIKRPSAAATSGRRVPFAPALMVGALASLALAGGLS